MTNGFSHRARELKLTRRPTMLPALNGRLLFSTDNKNNGKQFKRKLKDLIDNKCKTVPV